MTTHSRLEAELLRRLASLKNSSVGTAMGVDESTVSRIASGERGLRLNQLESFIAALGMKLVDETEVTVTEEYLSSIESLSRLGIGHRPKR